MNVEILSITQEPLKTMYVAARTCYSHEAPQEIAKTYSEEKALKLLKKIIDSGHHSLLEHVNVTFAIDGISRSIANQLVRHRHCTFSQKSTRYCKIKNSAGSIQGYIDLAEQGNPFLLKDLCSTYFVVDLDNTDLLINYAKQLIKYLELTEQGVKAEDAREVLPLALKTSLVMTCNLRELVHIANLRLCSRSQYPIRKLVQSMVNLTIEKFPFIKPYLVPKCEANGINICTEDKCCHRRPHISEVNIIEVK